MSAPDLASVQDLVARWWFSYDAGDFDAWRDFFTGDARFSCRSDSGETEFEDFIRADLSGREEVVAWQVDHRKNSPYPLRHHTSNVHLTDARDGEANFRFYLFCTQVAGGVVANLASGICEGTARADGGALRLADLRVVLDFTDSEVFSELG